MKTKTDIKLDRELKRATINKRIAETKLIESKIKPSESHGDCIAPEHVDALNHHIEQLNSALKYKNSEFNEVDELCSKLRIENFTLNAENNHLKQNVRKMKKQQFIILVLSCMFVSSVIYQIIHF